MGCNNPDNAKFGSAALEEILCRPTPIGAVEAIRRPASDSWSRSYPGLDSLPHFEGEASALRICIATEDIVGPVRNGGIGTTYTALAELLAKLGHDVVILYLKGHEVENETIEHWSDFYAAKQIHFVPVPNYARVDRYSAGSDRWSHASYNMFRYLLDHPMDVVHVSEWRGAGYLSLLAKRQGQAFEKTLFVVKASSPWLWNRLYGLHPLERLDDLAKVHAERRSVELADMVIGGSLHLLRWMHSQGYDIPRDRTFVQPNVVTFEHLSSLITTRDWHYRTRQPIDEIVFFGRLEARKGLLIFLRAIKRLLRQGRRLPAISFMGKPGAPLLEGAGGDVIRYIKSEASNWPMKVEILPDFQQYEALQYLLSGNRLAVAPSVIENSSLAVYEAAICRIPFIASDSGGTPELIAPDDHPRVLCPAHPIPLADKLSEVLDLGGYVATPSFDNEVNLEQWRQFHSDLGRGLLPRLLPVPRPTQGGPASVSVCIYHPEPDDRLVATLESLRAQEHRPLQIMVAVDADDDEAVERAGEKAAELGLDVIVLPAFDLDAGSAFNLLGGHSQGDYVLFLWSGAVLKPTALSSFAKVAMSSGAQLLTCFFRVVFQDSQDGRQYLSAELLGDVAQEFFYTDVTPMPLFVLRKVFGEIGGFTSDYRVLAHDHELVAKAQLYGHRCETVLQELCIVDGWSDERMAARGYNRSISEFRTSRPQLAAAPLALRETLSMAKGLQKALGRRGRLGGSMAVRRTMAKRNERLARLLTALRPAFIGQLRAEKAERRTARKAHGRDAVNGIALLGLEATIRSASRNLALHWQSSDGKRYSGRLFGIHNGTIYGWVRDDDAPDKVIELEGELDDGRRRVVAANVISPAIMPARDGIRGHGFALPVWRGPRGFRGDWRSREVVLRIRGTDLAIGEFTIPANPRALEACGFDGHCDLVDARIRGWVWQPAHPDNSVDVSAFIDGKFLARATANAVRDDLRAVNVGTGAYGFTIPVPKWLRDGTSRRVDVVVADTGTLLKKGRLQLKGNSLTLAKRK